MLHVRLRRLFIPHMIDRALRRLYYVQIFSIPTDTFIFSFCQFQGNQHNVKLSADFSVTLQSDPFLDDIFGSCVVSCTHVGFSQLLWIFMSYSLFNSYNFKHFSSDTVFPPKVDF